MLITIQDLQQMNFELTHEWVRNGPIIKANTISEIELARSTKPMVYAWVSPLDGSSEKFRLLYIGKAGGGVAKRLREHEGGFKNSGTGRKNYELILAVLESENPVQIFGRISDQVDILGQKISMYSAEEEALCDRFSPEWNRALFAKGSKAIGESPVRNSEKELPQKIHLNDVDFSGLARSEEVLGLIDSMKSTEKRLFADLLEWCFKIETKYGLEQKVILGYTNQPTGCNGVPMLVFANFGKAGKSKKDSWKIRVPLQRSEKLGLTVVLPTAYISNKVEESQISKGKDDNFIPLNLADFLRQPSKYVML